LFADALLSGVVTLARGTAYSPEVRALVVAAGVVLAVSACGGSSTRTVSPAAESSALHAAGFAVRQVRARTLATSNSNLPFIDLVAVRYDTASAAATAYQGGYSAKALAQQLEEAKAHPALYKGALPAHFAASMITATLVCNVIVSSYSPKPNPSLHQRFDRALALLKRSCR
jgi:hypothetical protein